MSHARSISSGLVRANFRANPNIVSNPIVYTARRASRFGMLPFGVLRGVTLPLRVLGAGRSIPALSYNILKYSAFISAALLLINPALLEMYVPGWRGNLGYFFVGGAALAAFGACIKSLTNVVSALLWIGVAFLLGREMTGSNQMIEIPSLSRPAYVASAKKDWLAPVTDSLKQVEVTFAKGVTGIQTSLEESVAQLRGSVGGLTGSFLPAVLTSNLNVLPTPRGALPDSVYFANGSSSRDIGLSAGGPGALPEAVYYPRASKKSSLGKGGLQGLYRETIRSAKRIFS